MATRKRRTSTGARAPARRAPASGKKTARQALETGAVTVPQASLEGAGRQAAREAATPKRRPGAAKTRALASAQANGGTKLSLRALADSPALRRTTDRLASFADQMISRGRKVLERLRGFRDEDSGV